MTPRRTRSVTDDSPASVRLLRCSRVRLKNDVIPNRRGHRGWPNIDLVVGFRHFLRLLSSNGAGSPDEIG